MKFEFKGEHVYSDIYNIDDKYIYNDEFLFKLISDGIKKSGAECCGTLIKSFKPYGFTAVFILNESHASIHTYPENNSMFVDIFTCGTSCKPKKCLDFLIENLGDVEHKTKIMNRGLV